MPQKAIAEALAIWREAERLLEGLPPEHPDRKVIQFELLQARALYRRLTERQVASREVIDESLEALQRAWLKLNAARDRIGENG
jgi:hypothetical protein